MNILGRICKITDYYVIVTLPGPIYGKLYVSNLSEAYTYILNNLTSNMSVSEDFKPITDLYKKGDFIVCCIKNLNISSKKILLSTEPCLINQNLNLNYLKQNSKVVLTIKGIEEHGYVLETGLKNFQAFLPFINVTEKNSLFCGKQIMCSILDLKKMDNTFIATVKKLYDDKDLEKTIVSTNLVPYVKHDLIIDKILHNGLQICYGENSIGYVNNFFLPKPLSFYKEGQREIGTLLYVMPTIKIAYFSLLTTNQENDNDLLPIGHVVPEAKVLSHSSRGTMIQLNKGIRGFIPAKFTKPVTTSEMSLISNWKIKNYDLMSKLYMCCIENDTEKVVANKIDINPGDIVEVTVTSVNKNGSINVTTGMYF